MNPFNLFVLAILSPFLLVMTLFGPPYAGVVVANYIIYDTGAKVHPLADKIYEVFYMMDVYAQLFSRWTQHISETSFLTYTVPLLLPVIFGIMLALWLTGKLSTKLKDIFQRGVSM